MQGVVDNPSKAVVIHGVQYTEDGGVKLNAETTFGDIVDLKAPYGVEHPKVATVFDIQFKLPLSTATSVEGQIIEAYEEYSCLQKKKVFNYVLADSSNRKIKVVSFFKLPFQLKKSYIISNVTCDIFENERLLKYDVSS